MKNILVINGVNLNMLGVREKELYGTRNYDDLLDYIEDKAQKINLNVQVLQSNHEGDLVDFIQTAHGNFDAIIINAGAYTHTSIAILDALKAASLPTVEVHLTDISQREAFRNFSYISLYAEKVIKGKGFDGYGEALEYLASK